MTPWRKRISRTVSANKELAASKQMDDPERSLFSNDLQRFEDRWQRGPEFRALVGDLAELWNLHREGKAAPDEERLRARLGLAKQLIDVPPLYKRHPYAPGPTELMEIVGEYLGHKSAAVMVLLSFDFVALTGDPDPWIRETGRARERGTIGAPVAHTLILHYARSALKPTAVTDEEHGVMEILLRNGEHAIAEAYQAADDQLYALGWLLLLGNLLLGARDDDDRQKRPRPGVLLFPSVGEEA